MATVPQLTPDQVVADTSVLILDVRKPEEVDTGAIAGSTNIPLGELSTRVGELDPGTPVIAVCRSGRRSQQAAETLAAAGYQAANLGGGMNAWVEAGKPVA